MSSIRKVKSNLNILKQDINFIAGAQSSKNLPLTDLMEVAFIGKSNVGKSTLINLICSRRKLARVSKTPGCTQQINFFSVNNSFILVDLPGYGYAKVSEKQHNKWENLILNYFKYRYNLKLLYILIDSRRGIKENDLLVIKLATRLQKKIQIVFTKEDKISFAEKEDLIEKNQNLFNRLGLKSQFIFTNTRSKDGVEKLQYNLLQHVSETEF